MIRRLAAAVAIAGLLGASAVQAHDVERQAELLDELLRLSSESIPEHIIVKQVRAWCFRFELDGDDIVELHTLGVSDNIIETLIDTAFQELECESDDYEYVWYRGAYSPWWYVPYAWGWYWWDPWPAYYAHHYYYPYSYYPCHYGYGYGYGYQGYYGWHGSDYYVAYNPRTHVPAPEPRARSGDDYTVLRGVPAAPVGAGFVAQQPRSRGVVVPNQQQVQPQGQGSTHIDSRSASELTPRSAVGAAAVTTPRAGGATQQPRLTPAKHLETPAALPSRPAAQPRANPRLEPVTPGRTAAPRTSTPAVQRPTSTPSPAKRLEAGRTSRQRVTPSQPAKRVDSKRQRPQRLTPSQPAKQIERGTKSTGSKRSQVRSRSTGSKSSQVKSRSTGSKSSQVKSRSTGSKRSQVKSRSTGSKRSHVKSPTRSNRSLSSGRSTRSRSVSRPPSRSRASAPHGRASSGSRGRGRSR